MHARERGPQPNVQPQENTPSPPHLCACGGRLILDGYAFASKQGFWLERKCARCRMLSVASSGYTTRPF
jgi:hypothetical protein